MIVTITRMHFILFNFQCGQRSLLLCTVADPGGRETGLPPPLLGSEEIFPPHFPCNKCDTFTGATSKPPPLGEALAAGINFTGANFFSRGGEGRRGEETTGTSAVGVAEQRCGPVAAAVSDDNEQTSKRTEGYRHYAKPALSRRRLDNTP